MPPSLVCSALVCTGLHCSALVSFIDAAAPIGGRAAPFMPSTNSISIIVPALNEEVGLDGAVRTMAEACEPCFDEYEILIVDDGSSDRTGEIAERLASELAEVSVIHHAEPWGLGGVIRDGWQHARMHYVMWVDGQGVTPKEALERIFAERGKADLIVPYADNQRDRSPLRQLIAHAFRGLMNTLFGLDLHQYTHLVVCPLAVARSLKLRTSSHAFQAEALIKMIKSGCSYVQVGVRDDFNLQGRRSKAFKLKNVAGVAMFVLLTVWDVYVARDYRFTPRPDGVQTNVR